MQCEQARQLFDAYLDGELSPSLATELGAHRLHCADCRQSLALLEVSGHILRSDGDPVQPSEHFTDRLLACVDTAPGWRRKVLNTIYVGGPLAAAAVIALAFIGVFDGKGPSQVAGVKEVANSAVQTTPSVRPDAALSPPAAPGVDPAERALGEFFDQTQQHMKEKGASVQRVLDLTVLQMLDILEEAKDRSQSEKNTIGMPLTVPAAAPPAPQDQPVGADSDEGELAPDDDTNQVPESNPQDD